MKTGRPPFWSSRLDRPKAAIAAVLAATALLLAVRVGPGPQIAPPVIQTGAPVSTTTGAPFTLEGKAAPGAKVQIYDGDALLGETTAGPDGAWSFTVPALPGGDHSLTARSTGPDSQPVISPPLTFNLPEVKLPEAKLPEFKPPALPDLKAGTPFTLEGKAAPGAKVQIYDGDTLLGETTAGPDGAWSFTAPALPAGDHSLTARTAGPDGQPVVSQPFAFNLPAAGPAEVKLPEFKPPALPALKADTPFTLEGKAEPGAKVQIYDGDTLLGEATAGPDGAWSFAAPALPAGDHSLTARTTGPDGQPVVSQPFAFNLPEVGPAEVKLPEFKPPALPDLKADAPFTLEGKAAPGAKVQIYDGDTFLGEATAGPDGAWSFTVPTLSAGDHSLTARTTGPDGQPVVSQPFAFNLPAAGPAEVKPAETQPAVVKQPEFKPPAQPDLKAGAPFTLEGEAAPGAKVQIYDGDTLLGEATAGPDGKWSFIVPALPAGDHSLTARTAGPDGQPVASQPFAFNLPAAGPSPYPAPYVITLAPGQTATLPVQGFCLNYGLPFPGPELDGDGLAPDAVRAAIAYSQRKGYIASDPLQVQLAIWTLIEGVQIPGQPYTLANEIIEFARTAPVPETGIAQNLSDALAKAQVTAVVTDFVSTSPTNYQYIGAGTLAVKNVSQQGLTLLIPYGVRFTDRSGAGTQDMGIFPTPQKK